jgi:hypothetical protein
MRHGHISVVGLVALALGGATMSPALIAQLPGPGGSSGQAGGSDHHFIRIGFGGGMSVPTNHAADALKNGVNGEGFLLVDLRVLPPIRLNLGYQKFDYKQLITGQPVGSTSMLSGSGGLSITVIPFGPIRPYVTAGLGAFRISDDFQNAPATATPTSSIKFGIDGGAGVRIKFGRLEAFVEGKVQNVYTDQGVIDKKTITSIPVAFGVLF